MTIPYNDTGFDMPDIVVVGKSTVYFHFCRTPKYFKSTVLSCQHLCHFNNNDTHDCIGLYIKV